MASSFLPPFAAASPSISKASACWTVGSTSRVPCKQTLQWAPESVPPAAGDRTVSLAAAHCEEAERLPEVLFSLGLPLGLLCISLQNYVAHFDKLSTVDLKGGGGLSGGLIMLAGTQGRPLFSVLCQQQVVWAPLRSYPQQTGLHLPALPV